MKHACSFQQLWLRHQVWVYNSSNLPSLSRMSTVTVSPPGANEAGAVTLQEISKLSVPSRSWSSQILITRTWTLVPLMPWSHVPFVSNVSVEFAREKSSPSARSVIKSNNWLWINAPVLNVTTCSSTCNLPVALPLTAETVTITGSWRVTLGGLSWNWIPSLTTLPSLAVVVFSRNWTWIAVCVHVNSF